MAELINPRTKQWTGEDAVLIQAGDGMLYTTYALCALAFVATEP